MNSKKQDVDKCGNCGHRIVTDEVNCLHFGNSCCCLERNCICLDPTGRDIHEVGARYPFNKVRNQDCLQGLVTL